MATSEQEASAAIAEIMGLILVADARVTSDMPTALSLYDHLTTSSREALKKEWDTLRAPEFSKNFEAGLTQMVTTMRKIHADTLTLAK